LRDAAVLIVGKNTNNGGEGGEKKPPQNEAA